MALYAKITPDLQDTGERRNFQTGFVPPAKANLATGKPYWVPVTRDADPDLSGSGYRLSTLKKEITETGLREYREAEAVTVTAQMVKDEAYRRIVAICPEWRQRNLTAQATLLAEKGRANWTSEELAAWNAGEAIWTQIKALRDASDRIEAMNPIPADFDADGRWTS